MKNALCLLLNSLALFLTLHSLRAEDIVFPTDSGVLNVRNAPYGAKGDGVTDDTAAIQAALSAGVYAHMIVYLPNGTYLVSNTLAWKNLSGVYGDFLSMQGESRLNTIIKLANNASGFGNPSARKAVIYTASGNATGTYDNSTGNGNQAFENSIQNLTVDIGSGNAGATGIDYQVSNTGALRNVTIKSSDANKVGAVGIDMERRDNGPGLIQNVSVDGFQYGIAAGGGAASAYSLEHITLTNQSVMNLWIDNAVVAVRDLTTTAAPSAISVYEQGQISLLGGSFTGGTSGNPAVTLTSEAYGYFRGVSSSGYGYLFSNRGTAVSGSSFTEYSSNGTVAGLGSTATLQLPISETPTYYNSNLSQWISVGAPSGSDDTTAIQNAMNAATTTNGTVYFPSGKYYISNTITVPVNVKHIIGCGIELAITGSNFSDGRSLFRFSGGTSANTTVFERLFVDSGSGVLFDDASSRNLVIREIFNLGNNGYTNEANAGYLYLEDVALNRTGITHPQTVWARQLNTEHTVDNDLIYNNGGTLWILGNKTENPYTVVDNENGASTEDFGQLSYTFGVNPSTPNFINHESSLTMSSAGTNFLADSNNTPHPYIILVADTQNGTTDNVPTSGQPGRTFGAVNVALFSSTRPQRIANASFETPSVGSSSFQYDPTGGSWTFTSNSGIQSNGSAWFANNAPDGTQTAFLQGTNGANGTISQSITFTAGTFSISFQAAKRVVSYGGTQTFNVTIDGTVVGSFSPTSASFSSFSTNPFSVGAGSHSVAFVGTSTSGDDTAFIDLVTIASENSGAPSNTGAGLADGAVDSNWTITASPNGASAAYVVPEGVYPFPYWFADSSTSKWIAPTAASGAPGAPGVYTYQTTFTLGTSTSLILNLAGDDTINAVRLNGTAIMVPSGTGFGGFTTITIPASMLGAADTLETLQIDVTNNGTSSNPTGLRAEITPVLSQAGNTGDGLADGATDPGWTITASPGGASAAYVVTEGVYPFPYWFADSNTSKWIAPTAANGASGAPGVYTYQTTITLATNTSLVLNLAGDDTISAVRLNGTAVTVPSGTGFGGFTTITIPASVVGSAGNKTLQVDVTNNGTSNNPTGLRAELSTP